jgi:predicted metalloprotease with PDZ domain
LKEQALHYDLSIADPQGHYFDVQLSLLVKASKLELTPDGLRALTLRLPSWIPGSYLIREFSRNVVSFESKVNDEPCMWRKTCKDEWTVLCKAKAKDELSFDLSWRVYAWDLSVRGAHLDETHAFFNGTSVFLCPVGWEDEAVELTIQRPVFSKKPTGLNSEDWWVATGLDRVESAPVNESKLFKVSKGKKAGNVQHGCAKLPPGGKLEFSADNFDALIDHPVEMGALQTASFMACGVPHYFAVYGADADMDLDRICADLKPVCEAQIKLFEPKTEKAPFEGYWFLLHATHDGYGGLEHRNSTALLCSRKDLPQVGVEKAPEGYDTFLGLCSHEYFHSWNVKRMKPAAFTPYDLRTENYTRLLWVFEGFTSYYDDVMLARAGKMTDKAYLKALGKTVSQVLKNPGSKVQPVAESSFEAWTKYYRQDENAPNAIVSYYTKGALVALCMDSAIRSKTDGAHSLDDVMRLMWKKHGKKALGVPEGCIADLVLEATGVDLSDELETWTETTAELPLQDSLKVFGFELKPEPQEHKVYVGLQGGFKPEGMAVKNVINGSPAHHAGIAAGDVLVAWGDRRMLEVNYQRALKQMAPSSRVKVLGFRAERLMEFDVQLVEAKAQAWEIVEAPKDEAAAVKVMKAPWVYGLD